MKFGDGASDLLDVVEMIKKGLAVVLDNGGASEAESELDGLE